MIARLHNSCLFCGFTFKIKVGSSMSWLQLSLHYQFDLWESSGLPISSGSMMNALRFLVKTCHD